MSTQDVIANMLTCIRNGQNAKKDVIYVPFSKFKEKIILLLKREGFINDYKIKQNTKCILEIFLKYFNNQPVITTIRRISKPSLRIYKKKNKLPKIMSGMGIAIISTSNGVMTDKQARKIGIGGEIICYVT